MIIVCLFFHDDQRPAGRDKTTIFRHNTHIFTKFERLYYYYYFCVHDFPYGW